jgi:hypothetical protein
MFDNYKKQPREENWQDIKNKLNEDRSFEYLGAKFDGFATKPADQNWNAIQDKMLKPQPNYGRRIAGVAASLVLLLFIFSDSKDSIEYDFTAFNNSIDFSQALVYDICEDSPILSLDIVTPVVITEKKKIKKKRKKKEAKQKRLLDIILADDDGINSEVDSMLIATLLEPANMLPDESMFASKGGSYYYHQGSSFNTIYMLPELDYKLQVPADTFAPSFIQVVNFEEK